MQVCTHACGKVASIASGKPVRPSTQAITTSSTPRRLRSLRTERQNLSPSVSCHQDPQHLAFAVTAHAEREVAGAVLDRAVLAHLHHQRVQVNDRIDHIKRPGPPRPHFLEHRVGDPADRVAADLDAVKLAHVRGDVTHGHTAGVEPENLVVQPASRVWRLPTSRGSKLPSR
jgi:hypothetical protein